MVTNAFPEILCDTAARLHAPRSGPPPDLHPLQEWFQPLFRLAAEHAALAPAASVARQLLAAPREVCPLHGDLHHENVLDFGDRGWLAIDPHGLLGERTFDYANIFTNPDLSDPGRPLAILPGRLEARLSIVVGSKLTTRRLLAIPFNMKLQQLVHWIFLAQLMLIVAIHN
ncbi:aminoglycoside phosphotransferase family protein [Haemophilus influenzae]|uniref:aminoglycoside phosphotransferase family protein n=1 Tax=Haemophilus influenzae TaxID=727 RepID=UPI003DA9EDE3